MSESEDDKPMVKVKSDRSNEVVCRTNTSSTSRINVNIEHNQWKELKSSQNPEEVEGLVITTTKEGVDKTSIIFEGVKSNHIKIKLKWMHFNPYWRLSKLVEYITREIEAHNKMEYIIIIGLFEQIINASPGIYITRKIIRQTKQVMKQVSEVALTTQTIIFAEQLFTTSTVHKRDIIYRINDLISQRNKKLAIHAFMPLKIIQKTERYWKHTQQTNIYKRKVDTNCFDGNGELQSQAREKLARYMLKYVALIIERKN